MKDNNMTSKIRLNPEHAYSVIDTLNADSDALCGKRLHATYIHIYCGHPSCVLVLDMGVMDYSLLIGVKNMQYDIDSHSAGRRRLSSSFSADVPPYSHPQQSMMMPMMRESERRNNSIIAHNHTSHVNFNLNTNTQSMPAAMGANHDLTHSNAYPARAVIAPCEYYLGVIDILQTWSFSKWAERMFKVYILNQPAEGHSRTPYAHTLYTYIHTYTYI